MVRKILANVSTPQILNDIIPDRTQSILKMTECPKCDLVDMTSVVQDYIKITWKLLDKLLQGFIHRTIHDVNKNVLCTILVNLALWTNINSVDLSIWKLFAPCTKRGSVQNSNLKKSNGKVAKLLKIMRIAIHVRR